MLENLSFVFGSGANIVFFILALFAIGGAIFMINFTKVVHMVISLTFTFLSLAGLYILLDAEFLAFVQVLIYAGAVSILMIFGIMMTKHRAMETEIKRPLHSVLLGIGMLALFGILFYAIQSSVFPAASPPVYEDNTMAIGETIFTLYVIPFELISLLLTVALIGAIVIAKREED